METSKEKDCMGNESNVCLNRETDIGKIKAVPAVCPWRKNAGKRVLDAAERLFAERGIERFSIRDITARRRGKFWRHQIIHFGTKQELVGEIFSRRLTPLSQERTGFAG